jgi:hypothetical protein
LTKAFGKPKQRTILSYTDNDVDRNVWLRDAPVDPPTLHGARLPISGPFIENAL